MRMMSRAAVWVVLAAGSAVCLGQVAAPAQAPGSAPAAKKGDPTRPAIKENSPPFLKLHEQFLKQAKEGGIDVLFLGDSITAGWMGRGKEVWEKNYAPMKAAEFGIGGDRVEHLLWRIENGELEGISPKVVVLMIGTNNTGVNTADEIAAGDEKVVKTIREKLPNSKILVLGIFPRGPRKDKSGKVTDDGVKKMEIIKTVNERLSKLDDGKMVRYLDIGDKFLVDGKIPDDVMPDQLHPNAKGYQIWVDAMGPTLAEMMK